MTSPTAHQQHYYTEEGREEYKALYTNVIKFLFYQRKREILHQEKGLPLIKLWDTTQNFTEAEK